MGQAKPKTIKPLAGLCSKVTFLLWAQVGLSALSIPLTVLCAYFPIAEKPEDITLVQMASAFGGFGVGILNSIAYSVGAVMFLVWLHRAYQNLVLSDVPGLRFNASKAVYLWFFPIYNLYKPLRVVEEVWRASNSQAEGVEWEKEKTPRFFGTWWALWLVTIVASQVSLRLAAKNTAADAGAVADIINDIATIPGALLLMRIMREITHRQLHKIPGLNKAD